MVSVPLLGCAFVYLRNQNALKSNSSSLGSVIKCNKNPGYAKRQNPGAYRLKSLLGGETSTYGTVPGTIEIREPVLEEESKLSPHDFPDPIA